MGQRERWKDQDWKVDLTPGEKTEARTKLRRKITQEKPVAERESQWVKLKIG